MARRQKWQLVCSFEVSGGVLYFHIYVPGLLLTDSSSVISNWLLPLVHVPEKNIQQQYKSAINTSMHQQCVSVLWMTIAMAHLNSNVPQLHLANQNAEQIIGS